MKDLYVLTADADAQAVMQQVLRRHAAIKIRQITFDVERHPGRDPGMIQSGPELARFQKGKFHHVLLLWDLAGCGKNSMDDIYKNMTGRMDGFTWKDRYITIMAVPELEEWLWFNTASLLKHLDITEVEMNAWIREFAEKKGQKVQAARREQPKEIFEFLVLKRKKRKPRMEDFENIAAMASLAQWQKSQSFSAMVAGLRQWFPPTPPANLQGNHDLHCQP